MQAEAYAPLMQDLAERGFLCVIVPMPFNLAVLDANGADGVQERFPAVRRWILMGRSLGGVMAAGYLDGHPRSWDGLVLLGAYSTAGLSDDGVTVLSITGDSDGVLNRQAAADNEGNLGEDARELVIPGGNHAQFGSYGPQDGDGEASLSSESNGPSLPTKSPVCFCEGGGLAGRVSRPVWPIPRRRRIRLSRLISTRLLSSMS